jgi:apolipoprotein N-acyltransferase
MPLWGNFLCVVLSAAFLTLSFPPFDLPALAWVALVPLLLLITRSSLLRAFIGAFSVGMLFTVAHEGWMLRIDGMHPGNFSPGVLGSACYFALFGLLAHYFHAKLPRWNVLTFPTGWVLVEYLRANVGFLSFPWGTLGYSQYTVLPVAQLAAWTSVYGVSFLLVGVNAVVVEVLLAWFSPSNFQEVRAAWSRPARTLAVRLGLAAVIFVALVALVALLVPYRLLASTEPAGSSSLTVALVQSPLYSQKTEQIRSREKVLQAFSRLTLQAADASPALIAWPDSSAPGRIPYDRGMVAELAHLARQTKAFLLVGTYGYDKLDAKKREHSFANSAFLLSPQGKMIDRYDKIRLLPFDEYLPLRGVVTWPLWIVADGADYRVGSRLTVFRMNDLRFGVQICWENLFPDQFREMAAQGVDFMVSMTNESFIDAPAAHYQMLAMNVFRAIENHVAIIRTTPTGVSAIIGPDGQILARLQDATGRDVRVEGSLTGILPLVSDRSFYTRHGDWFLFLLVGLQLGLMVLAWGRGREYLYASPVR